MHLTVDGAIATITLDRPEAANALDAASIDQLDACLDQIELDEDIAVVVLRAEGKHFCAGHDLKELLAGRGALVRPAGHPRGSAPPRAGPLLGPDGSPPRHPADHHRRGAGRLLGRRPDAGLHVRPHRGRRRRHVLEPGGPHVRRRRRAAGRAVGGRAPQGQGAAAAGPEVGRPHRRAPRAGQPGRRPRRPLGGGAADGRRRRAGPAAHRRGHQALDQRDARPHGPARLVAAALLDAPVRVGHAHRHLPGGRPPGRRHGRGEGRTGRAPTRRKAIAHELPEADRRGRRRQPRRSLRDRPRPVPPLLRGRARLRVRAGAAAAGRPHCSAPVARAAAQRHRGVPDPGVVRARAAALRPSRWPPAPTRPFDEPGLTHISLSVEDLDAAIALVPERGGRVVSNAMGAYVVRDPDGQLIELLPMAYRRRLAGG